MNILIFGGYGSFGSFYSKLLKKNGFNIFIEGNSEIQKKYFCEKNQLNFFEGDFEKIDIIILSVPNSVAPNLLKEISKKIKKGTFIFDFCSVKSNIVPELKKLKNKGFELASIHPMHGPRVKNVSGYPLILIPIEIGKKFEIIMNFFKKQNFNIIESTSEEHDKILSIVQGLTHYSQIVSAETIKEIGINIKRSRDFGSPNYELFLNLISRIVLQNPELYSQIQTENPFNKEMREIFVEKAKKLEKIADEGNSKEVEKEIINSAQIFNANDNILFCSDLVVSALKFVENTLREHINGKILLENIITNSFHYGVIKEVNSNKIKIIERHKITTMALNNIRLTTKKEMRAWKEKNLLKKHLDYSVFIPQTTKKEFLLKIFNNLKIADFECVDEYSNPNFPENKKSITIRANFFEDDDKEKIDKTINDFLTQLNFERR